MWDKCIPQDFSMAMCEYAWTSFNANAKIFKCQPQGNKKNPRIHPCEKPIALYEWLLNNYAKQGDKILDTHLGSGTSRIAAHRMGFDFVGCEINEFYFRKQEERFANETAQVSIFDLL